MLDGYRFKGFYARVTQEVVPGDPDALVIGYTRRSKKLCAGYVVETRRAGTTKPADSSAIYRVAIGAFTWESWFAGSIARFVGA